MQYARECDPESQVLTYADQLPQLLNVGMLFLRLCKVLKVYMNTNNWELETKADFIVTLLSLEIKQNRICLFTLNSWVKKSQYVETELLFRAA